MATLVVHNPYGSSKLQAVVDDALHADLDAFVWRARRNRNGLMYPARWDKRSRRWLYLHIEVWKLMFQSAPLMFQSAPAGYQIDHKDNDTFNVQYQNLRLATPSQNGANRRRASTHTNQYRGVSVVKKTGRFQARIRVQRKQIILGTFATPDEAARAYDAAALHHFGQFARPNF